MTRPQLSLCAALSSACSLALTITCNGQTGTEAAASNTPDFVKENIERISAKGLASRQWPKVKIPGFELQQRNAGMHGDSTWKNIAPGFANVIYDVKIDNGVVTIVLDGAGLAQSKDGGATWRQISYGIEGYSVFFSFDISPANQDLIVLAGKYLSRTLDGGKTWSTIYGKALPPCALRHALEPYGSAEKGMAKICPKKTVYIGDAKAGDFKAIELDSPFAGLRTICPHPENPDIVYLAFADGSIYVTRDAKAERPSFMRLELPEGYEAVCIDVSPWNPTELLLTLHPRSKELKSKIMIMEESGTDAFNFRDAPILDAQGKEIFSGMIVMAKWNPQVKGQVFVGSQDSYKINYLMVSDDFMKSFRKIDFPKSLKHDEALANNGSSFYSNPHRFFFDRKSPLSVTCSCIGAWSSTDQFKTWSDLLITYDDSKRLYGNKGAGFAECADSICIRPKHAYFSTNDHGAFRSDGDDYTKWTRITTNRPGLPSKGNGESWMGLAFPIGVSQDEKYTYIIAREGWPNDPYSCKKLKVLRSLNQGDSWQDVTSRLGRGDVMEFGTDDKGITHNISKVLIDPENSLNQWILFSNALYVSRDGGETFKKTESPLFNSSPSYFREIAFDSKHKVLYIGNHFSFAGGASLARSFDYGETWQPLELGLKTIYALAVTASGNLALGVDGKLLVVPFPKLDGGKIEDSMVKMTTGDTPEEFAAAQMTFRPIEADGENIVAFIHSAWKKSNIIAGKGPLLSEDDGKSFRWIAYNLPCAEGYATAIGDGKIIIGNRGIYYWKFK